MRFLPNAVGPSCATPFPGRDAATDLYGVAGLSVTSETGTLVPPAGPMRTENTAREGIRRATLAGSAGIQITRRTARTPWEHWPSQVLRDDAEPSLPRRKKHHFAEKQHGLGEPQGPTGPQMHSDLASTEALIAGVVVARWTQPPVDPTTSRERPGEWSARPASWVLNEVEDAGPPMPPGPMMHTQG